MEGIIIIFACLALLGAVFALISGSYNGSGIKHPDPPPWVEKPKPPKAPVKGG